MTEENKGQSKQLLITVLMLVLIVFAAVQTWYITGMRKQLDELQNLQATTQSLLPETIAPETAISDTASPEAVQPDTDKKPPEPAAADNQLTPTKPDSPPDLQVQPQTQPRAGDNNPVPATPPSFNDDFFNTPYDRPSWDPYEEIERMQREMDRLFNQSFNRPYYRPYSRPDFKRRDPQRPDSRRPDFEYFFQQDLSMPEMDVKEDRTQYIILVNLPGADENDISVSLDEQRLTIKGKRKSQKQNRSSDGNIVFSERRSGNFKRSITLPEPVIEAGMKTKIENGVLTIIIPKYKHPA